MTNVVTQMINSNNANSTLRHNCVQYTYQLLGRNKSAVLQTRGVLPTMHPDCWYNINIVCTYDWLFPTWIKCIKNPLYQHLLLYANIHILYMHKIKRSILDVAVTISLKAFAITSRVLWSFKYYANSGGS